jgi:hypothetical protein
MGELRRRCRTRRPLVPDPGSNASAGRSYNDVSRALGTFVGKSQPRLGSSGKGLLESDAARPRIPESFVGSWTTEAAPRGRSIASARLSVDRFVPHFGTHVDGIDLLGVEMVGASACRRRIDP